MSRYFIVIILIFIAWATGQEETVVTDPCLELTLQVEPAIQLGQTLQLKLKLKNICNQTAIIYLSGNPAYDFAVTDSEGIEQWRWLQGKAIAMSLMVLPIEPGQEHIFEATWDLIAKTGEQLQAGHYTIQGFLKGEWPNTYQTEAIPLDILP